MRLFDLNAKQVASVAKELCEEEGSPTNCFLIGGCSIEEAVRELRELDPHGLRRIVIIGAAIY